MLHFARSEGHERYFGCNLMHPKALASSHQHLMTEAPVGFAVEPIAVVEYLDLVGSAIPLADEMGAGRNGPCGSGRAVALRSVRYGGQSAPGCSRMPAMWRSYARTRRRRARESELGGAAPKVCSQTRRRLGRSKPSRSIPRPTPVSCGITGRSLFCPVKSSPMGSRHRGSSSARRYAIFFLAEHRDFLPTR